MYKPFNLYVGEFCLTPDSGEFITETSGINPLKSNLVSVTPYNYIGAIYQGATKGTRNIVLEIEILQNVNENRESILGILKSGEPVELKFVDDDKTLYIDGVVESILYDRFEVPKRSKQLVQVSIICFHPYFRSAEITRSGDRQVVAENNGDFPTDFKIEMYDEYGSTLSADTFYIQVNDESLSFETNIALKKIIIDTEKKKIEGLNSNDEVVFESKALLHGSVWPQLQPGENTISQSVMWSSFAYMTIIFSEKFDKV